MTRQPDAARTMIDVFARPKHRAIVVAMFGLLYFLAAKIGVLLIVMPEAMAILWPPNGVLLAFLIRFGQRDYIPLAIVTLLAEIAADVPTFHVTQALLFGLINLAEATAARALLRRWNFDERFATVQDLFKFLLAAPIIAGFGAALFGGLVYAVFRAGPTPYIELVRTWWFGDAVGLVIVTPLLLCSWRAVDADNHELPGWQRSDVLAAIGAIVAVAVLILARDGVFIGLHVGTILVLPFLMYVATRWGVAASAAALAGASFLILLLTALGRNPFGHGTARETIVHAQEFIMVASIMTLGLAATVAESRNARRHLESAVEDALSHVKHLRGLMPICAWCKKIRDDENYWHAVEDYVSKRTDAQFSHGICPDCSQRFSDNIR